MNYASVQLCRWLEIDHNHSIRLGRVDRADLPLCTRDVLTLRSPQEQPQQFINIS